MHAIYAGTFDPFHNGHLTILTKAKDVFDKITVVVADGENKKTKIAASIRIQCIKKILKDLEFDIQVIGLPSNTFLAHFASSIDASVLVRGIRDGIDFEYERKIERFNSKLNPHLQTVFFPCAETYGHVSSSWIKGLVNNGGAEFALSAYCHPFSLSALYSTDFDDLKDECRGIVDFEKAKEFYLWNHYHNFVHLSYMVKWLKMQQNLMSENGIFVPLDFLRANYLHSRVFLHDIGPEISGDSEYRNTMYECCQYDTPIVDKQFTPIEKMIRVADLKVLAETEENYKIYQRYIYQEYRTKSNSYDFYHEWVVGRSKVLEQLKNIDFKDEVPKGLHDLINPKELNDAKDRNISSELSALFT